MSEANGTRNNRKNNLSEAKDGAIYLCSGSFASLHSLHLFYSIKLDSSTMRHKMILYIYYTSEGLMAQGRFSHLGGLTHSLNGFSYQRNVAPYLIKYSSVPSPIYICYTEFDNTH